MIYRVNRVNIPPVVHKLLSKMRAAVKVVFLFIEEHENKVLRSCADKAMEKLKEIKDRGIILP